jgi:cell division transport system permease protein
MSFSYTLRESFSGFRRTKLSSLLSIATICISLLLLGVFAAVTINATRLIQTLRSRLEMEAFLQEPISDDDVTALQSRVQAIEGVEKVIFISKDEAARIFRQEFGEDINKVLDFNPLPPSFKITLVEQYRTSEGTAAIYQRLMALQGIESVVYRRTLLELIDKRAKTVNRIMLGLGVAVSFSAIFLVGNTIRLSISAKRNLIQTMELVGATRRFVRRPFLIEGIIQGLFGGAFAAGILKLAFEELAGLVSAEFAPYLRMPSLFYLAIVCAGIILGLIGSTFSALRFVRPSVAQ